MADAAYRTVSALAHMQGRLEAQPDVRSPDGLELGIRALENPARGVRLVTMRQQRMQTLVIPASEIMRRLTMQQPPIMGHRRTMQRPAAVTRWQIVEQRPVVRLLRPTALDLPPAAETQQRAVERRRIVAARWRVVELPPIAAVRRQAAVARWERIAEQLQPVAGVQWAIAERDLRVVAVARWRAGVQRPAVAPAVVVMPLVAAGAAGAGKNSFLALAS
jgi:hypothetical protein